MTLISFEFAGRCPCEDLRRVQDYPKAIRGRSQTPDQDLPRRARLIPEYVNEIEPMISDGTLCAAYVIKPFNRGAQARDLVLQPVSELYATWVDVRCQILTRRFSTTRNLQRRSTGCPRTLKPRPKTIRGWRRINRYIASHAH